MERCVGKEKVSRNKPGGVWAAAKETSLDRLARGMVASPASTSPGKRDRIQSHNAKLAAASMQDPGKALEKFPPRWEQASATTKRGEMNGSPTGRHFRTPMWVTMRMLQSWRVEKPNCLKPSRVEKNPTS